MPQIITVVKTPEEARTIVRQAAALADELERDGRPWTQMFNAAVPLLAGVPFLVPDPAPQPPNGIQLPGLRAMGQ